LRKKFIRALPLCRLWKNNEMFVKDFKEINKDDIALVGGKGASLGELLSMGLNVPEGFVLTTEIYGKNLSDFQKEILIQFNNLNTKLVAVRSSANVEDSPQNSFAGQFETYLNVTRENLLENIEKCWDSVNSARVSEYLKGKGINKDKIKIAVIIQKMVDSEKSGIAFSVHPVTQDRNQIIIEAGLGLSETIVSGQITPDSYVVEKNKLLILDKNITGEKQVLSDREILELSKLVLKIENHFGFPVDIEWAIESGKIYILQCRPITTL